MGVQSLIIREDAVLATEELKKVPGVATAVVMPSMGDIEEAGGV